MKVNSGSVKNQNKRYYVDGSAVPKLEPVKKKPKRRKQTSRVSSRAKRNRAKATQMSKGYVLFLGLICLVTLFVCVNYLQSESQLTNQTMELATLESQLSKLKADNDAYYNSTLASVDMEQIKNDVWGCITRQSRRSYIMIHPAAATCDSIRMCRNPSR